MDELFEYRQRMVNKFADAPGLIDKALTKLPDFKKPLEVGGWNVHQILVHMRDVNKQVYLPRLKRIMNEEDPKFINFDGDAWMKEHYDPEESLDSLLSELKEQCLSTNEWLTKLDSPSWNRNGTHPTIGTHTLQWWVERTLAHIDEHVVQLEEAAADQ